MGDDREVFGHLVDYEMTEAELKTQLERNADIDRKMGLIKADKAAANSGFNEDLKTLRKEQVTLLESISSGKARIEVQCYLERDERLNCMRTVRVDNGETVDTRALTADELNEERQGNLFEQTVGVLASTPDSDEEEEESHDADLDETLAAYQASQSANAANETSEGAAPDDEPEHEADDEDDETGAHEASAGEELPH